MSDQYALVEVLTNVKSHLQPSVLNEAGCIGEICAETILLLAFDNALKRGYHSEIFSKAITVEAFLNSLVGKEQSQFILDSVAQSMKNGLVYFTHFIKRLQDFTFQNVVPHALARCAAIQLQDDHENIDLVIPVVLEKSQISYIVIQVQNEVNPSNLEDIVKNALPIIDFYQNREAFYLLLGSGYVLAG